MKKLLLLTVIFLTACTKVVQPPFPVIDLGVKAQSTAIKSISQAGNIITGEFETTIGSKYSVQIIPFGSSQPVKKEGFTATETTTRRVYNLSDLAKKDYDLIFIDISGKEVKYPIIIK
jgi:hypothetical protein